jgi:hypothetical protein
MKMHKKCVTGGRCMCVAASIVVRGCAGRCSFVIREKNPVSGPPSRVSCHFSTHTEKIIIKKLKKKMKPHLCPYTNPPISLYKICTCVIRSLGYSFTSVDIKFDTLFNIIKQYPRRSQTIQDHLIPTFSQLTTTLLGGIYTCF